MRSKAIWGYDAAFMEACRAELSLTPAVIETMQVAVAELGGDVVGIAAIVLLPTHAELERLFVDPGAMRAGIGGALFAWARAQAERRGAKTLVTDADPSADAFYERMGGVQDGSSASGLIAGRPLPRFRWDLALRRGPSS